jgi:hypothetical protein
MTLMRPPRVCSEFAASSFVCGNSFKAQVREPADSVLRHLHPVEQIRDRGALEHVEVQLAALEREARCAFASEHLEAAL